MQKRKLVGLRPEAFEHPLDRWALNALKNTAGVDKAIVKIHEWGLERLLRIQLTGSYLRVSEDNFPEIYGLLTQACETLDVNSPPSCTSPAEPT